MKRPTEPDAATMMPIVDSLAVLFAPVLGKVSADELSDSDMLSGCSIAGEVAVAVCTKVSEFELLVANLVGVRLSTNVGFVDTSDGVKLFTCL